MSENSIQIGVSQNWEQRTKDFFLHNSRVSTHTLDQSRSKRALLAINLTPSNQLATLCQSII